MIYLAMLTMTLIGSIASIYFKKASSSCGIFELILNINVYIGGALYVIASLINIYVLKYLDYSVVLPMTSFTYMWTMILAFLVLKEKISIKKLIGIICIIIGAVCVAL